MGKTMLEKIDRLLSRADTLLSSKEKNFLESIRGQWIRRGSLSPGQITWFDSLKEKFSKENLEARRSWESKFSDQHRKTALTVAYYYEANPPYFSSYVEKIFSDPENFILSKKEWDKFCENKYAKRILIEHNSRAKFNKGDLVQIRRTNKLSVANYSSIQTYKRSNSLDKVGFVLKVGARPITRAARGSKIYQVLLAGATAPIFAHESDLKKARKKK